MQFRLYTVGLWILVGAIFLSGVVNNFLSALCVFAALVCWSAVEKMKGGTALAIFTLLG